MPSSSAVWISQWPIHQIFRSMSCPWKLSPSLALLQPSIYKDLILNIMKSIHVCIFSFASSPSQFPIRSSNCLSSILSKSLSSRALPYPSVSSFRLQTFAETSHSFKIVFSSWLCNASITVSLDIHTTQFSGINVEKTISSHPRQTALPASVGHVSELCPWLLSRGLFPMQLLVIPHLNVKHCFSQHSLSSCVCVCVGGFAGEWKPGSILKINSVLGDEASPPASDWMYKAERLKEKQVP